MGVEDQFCVGQLNQNNFGNCPYLRSSTHLFIYLFMKEGSLFCFILYCNYEIHQTRMLQIMFLTSLESSQQERTNRWCMGLVVPWWLDLRCKQKFLNIEWFFHWNFRRNWNVPLVLLERSWNLFAKIWIQNVRDIDF